MKTLYLLRHAKSSWQATELKDFDRPLNPRGRKACVVLGRYCVDQRINPDAIMVSAAARTRETYERLHEVAKFKAKPRFDKALYAADAGKLLDRVHDTPKAVASLMLIGHNPAIQELALMLAGRGKIEALDRLERKYPTGALAELRIDRADWAKVKPSDATLAAFIMPRRLG